MNAENHDIEQMRKAWIEMGKALGMETPPNTSDNLNKMKTDLDRLRTRYMKGWEGSIIGGTICTVLLFWMPSLNDAHRIPMATAFAILMSINTYALYRLWRGTGKINPLTMSINRVSSMTKHYKKCHLLYNLIGFPVAILWTLYFMFVTNRSESIVMGAIIGGICGLYSLWKYLKDYRNLEK